jgi:hypothetical protein
MKGKIVINASPVILLHKGLPISEETKRSFSEQDTADKLILPYLSRHLGFPPPDSLDYQAQHTVPIGEDRTGRYDGMYLHGGYPYVVLEAKKYAHDFVEQG